MRSTNLFLVGGIGNQLFGIYAGLYMRELYGVDVNFNYLVSSVNKHSNVISEINFSRDLVINYENKISKFGYLSGKLNYLARNRSRTFNEFCNKFTNKYVSPTLGFDVNISKLEGKFSLDGYFQTYIYYNELRNSGISAPFLTNKSKWFVETSAMIEQIKPIVLHIRLGDYLNHPKVFVKLKSEYYSKAITLLPKHLQNNPIWVFSDNELLAKEFIKTLPKRNYQIIDQYNQKSAEVLFLMSQGISHIIANSTFSWWAAKLSQNSKIVIAPKDWFVNREVPKNFLQEDWMLI